MLNLTRRAGESIIIGDDIRITIRKINGGQAVVSIEAPKEINIVREELVNGCTESIRKYHELED